jgi:hypothetical protein
MPLRHAARHEAAHFRVAIDVMFPHDRPADLVRLGDDCAIRHVHPLVIDPHAKVPMIGFPIRIGNRIAVRIGAALPKLAVQAFELGLQRRVGVAAVVVSVRRCRKPKHGEHERCAFCPHHLLPIISRCRGLPFGRMRASNRDRPDAVGRQAT